MKASIAIERESYAPGEMLRGRVTVERHASELSRTIELAVLWETEGKGSTDLGVVFYEVLSDGSPSATTHPFEVQLPPLPLTYEGRLVRIGWRARVRMLASPLTEDTVIDAPFRVEWPE